MKHRAWSSAIVLITWLAFCSTHLQSARAQGSWTAVAPMPTAREWLGAATGPDGRIYALGGAAFPSLATSEVLDTHTGIWTTIAPMPTPRGDLAVVTGPDGRIYAIGGEYYDGSIHIRDTVERYDTNTGLWSAVAPLPTPRMDLAAVTGTNGRIYAIGGYSSSDPNSVVRTVEALDPVTGVWSTVSPMPTARAAMGIAVGPDGRIYVMGGVNGSSYVSATEVYDTVTDSWTTVAPMPTDRRGFGCATGADGRIYAIGGDRGGASFATVESYDTVNNTWTALTPMPTDRVALAAATGPDGRVYAIGGYSSSIGADVNTVEALTPQSVDSSPPNTTATPSGTLGSNNWYTGPVQVTLSATDPDGTPDVAATSYTIDGGPTQTYSSAFNVFGDGTHTVNYWSVDQAGNTETAKTLSLKIDATLPAADTQSLTTAEDTSLAITLTGSDATSGYAGVVSFTQPLNGSLTGTAPNLTYTPAANFNGSDSFTFTVADNAGNQATATVSIAVTPVNDPPVANSQSVAVIVNTAKAITLTGSDVDGDALSYVVASQPAHGTLSGTAPNLTYTPKKNYLGPDSFTFTVSDGHGGQSTGTVSISVNAANRPPKAMNDSVTTKQYFSVMFNVLTNDSDPDGDSLTAISWTNPSFGSLFFQGGGSFVYAPFSNFRGKDSFTYTITDGRGGFATAMVSITVK